VLVLLFIVEEINGRLPPLWLGWHAPKQRLQRLNSMLVLRFQVDIFEIQGAEK
jgi:hypothetical protein